MDRMRHTRRGDFAAHAVCHTGHDNIGVNNVDQRIRHHLSFIIANSLLTMFFINFDGQTRVLHF